MWWEQSPLGSGDEQSEIAVMLWSGRPSSDSRGWGIPLVGRSCVGSRGRIEEEDSGEHVVSFVLTIVLYCCLFEAFLGEVTG